MKKALIYLFFCINFCQAQNSNIAKIKFHDSIFIANRFLIKKNENIGIANFKQLLELYRISKNKEDINYLEAIFIRETSYWGTETNEPYERELNNWLKNNKLINLKKLHLYLTLSFRYGRFFDYNYFDVVKKINNNQSIKQFSLDTLNWKPKASIDSLIKLGKLNELNNYVFNLIYSGEKYFDEMKSIKSDGKMDGNSLIDKKILIQIQNVIERYSSIWYDEKIKRKLY